MDEAYKKYIISLSLDHLYEEIEYIQETLQEKQEMILAKQEKQLQAFFFPSVEKLQQHTAVLQQKLELCGNVLESIRNA